MTEGAFSPAQCDEVVRGGVVWLATARGVEQGLAPEVGAHPGSTKQDSNEKHGIDHLHSLFCRRRESYQLQIAVGQKCDIGTCAITVLQQIDL